MALKNNTWKLNQWYDQSVAGNASYTGAFAGFFGWGRNSEGDLAQNSTAVSTYSSPIQISTDTTWNFYPAGHSFVAGENLLTKTDGTLWSWGYNLYGQLGQNNLTEYSSPSQIPGTNWNRMACGSEESALATKTDGTLWFWGYANHGGPGNGSHEYAYSSPIQVGTGTDWALGEYKSSVGQYGQCNVIKTDGTLWSWGYTSYGICGDTKNHSSPVQMPGTNWNAVSNSYARYIIATKTDGTLWSWGDNSSWMGGALFGDLAQGTRRSSPVQLPGTTMWDNVVATRRNAFARNIS